MIFGSLLLLLGCYKEDGIDCEYVGKACKNIYSTQQECTYLIECISLWEFVTYVKRKRKTLSLSMSIKKHAYDVSLDGKDRF